VGQVVDLITAGTTRQKVGKFLSIIDQNHWTLFFPQMLGQKTSEEAASSQKNCRWDGGGEGGGH